MWSCRTNSSPKELSRKRGEPRVVPVRALGLAGALLLSLHERPAAAAETARESPSGLPPLPEDSLAPGAAGPDPLPPLPDDGSIATPQSRAPDRESLASAIRHRLNFRAIDYPGGLDAGIAPLWVELQYEPRLVGQVSAEVTGVAELLLRGSYSKRYFIRPGRDRQDWRWSANSDRQRLVPKELYLKFDEAIQLSLGWQLSTWSRSDGIRPLDVFVRQDQTDRLRPVTLGVPAAVLAYAVGDLGLELVWSPAYSVDLLPSDDANIWTTPRVGATRLDSARPENGSIDPAHGELGVRLTWSTEIWDLAVVAATARDRSPSFLMVSQSDDGIAVTPQYREYGMVGASIVRPLGGFLLRLEGLYAKYADDLEPFLQSGWRGVAGIETRGQLGPQGSYALILQYAADSTAPDGVIVSEDRISSPFRIFRHAATASLLASWAQDFSADLRLFGEIEHRGALGSLELRYRVQDGLSLWLAGHVLAGSKQSAVAVLNTADSLSIGAEVLSN